MDPHSTRSQFNQRTPKSGPFALMTRFTDQTPKIAIERYAKPPPTTVPDPLLSLVQRPIATNSRVRQGEQFKRDMFVAFINKALQEKLDGQSKDFDDLVDQFNPKRARESASSSSQLRLWILALSHVLSKLEKRHAALVEAVVSLPWTTMDAAFVKSYTVFVGMLLSARPEYLSLVLGMIAQGLTYQSGLQALDAGGPESSASPLTRGVVYDRLHHLLRHLLSLIPTLPSTLHPLLVRHFPHKRQSEATHVTYIRNLLRVTAYCAELADRILALIIDRALQIDVEIQVELEELERDDTLENGELFEFDPFDVVVGQEGDADDGSDAEEDDAESDLSTDVSSDAGSDSDSGPDLPANARHMHEMVHKLDGVLKQVFDHFHRLHHLADPDPSPDADAPPPDAGATQFHALLAIFDRAVLRTFKSRYTQFLVFWYASLDPAFSDLFQGLLVEKLIARDVPVVTRAAAASYIASFVSRATVVDREGARRVVGVLCGFLGAHLDGTESAVEAGETLGTAHHAVFHAVAQAVFLVFCFRWRDLEEEGDAGAGRRWMGALDVVQRAITSPLNPLKVCAPTVVLQFARVARATDFVYCHSIIEANKRGEHPSVGLRAALAGASAELHTFFPFDPYRLPRSASYIQGVYREWSSVAIGGDESDEEDGEDVDGNGDGTLGSDAEASGGLQIPRAPEAFSPDADGLGASFGEMSISPAQPRSVVMAS